MLNVKATRKKRSRVRKAPAQKANRVVITTGQPTVNNGKKRKARRRQPRQQSMISPMLSECALEYAKAIADPWSDAALGACVPSAAGLTQRATGWIRGSTIIGTAGTGFLCCAPCVANDTSCLFYSGSGYTAGNGQIAPLTSNALATGVSEAKCSNLPWGANSLLTGNRPYQPAVSGRIVSAGLRVWYSGKETNRAGMLYGFRDPMHMSVQFNSGSTTPANTQSLASRRETNICPFDRKGITICDFPAYTEEADMSSYVKKKGSSFADSVAQTWTLYPFSGGESTYADTASSVTSTWTTQGVFMGIPTMAVTYAGTAGEIVNFEYVIHVEYGGPATAPFGVRAPVDPIGLQRVLDAASDAQINGPSTDRGSYWAKMMSALKDIQARAAPHVVPIIRDATRAYFEMYRKSQPKDSYFSAVSALPPPTSDEKEDDEDEARARNDSMVHVE